MGGTGDDVKDDGQDRFSVLEVFGLKLEVSNPRLAELLTMDAKTALTSDVGELVNPERLRETQAELREALPDTIITTPTVKEHEDSAHHDTLRHRVDAIGERLGFDVGANDVWESPTGVAIVIRAIDQPMSFAAASHYVEELGARRERIAGHDSTALFVVESPQAVDIFKVAIRQARLYELMRTISLTDLAHIGELYEAGALDHAQAVVLLAPIANIDVGEVLSIIRTMERDEPRGAEAGLPEV